MRRTCPRSALAAFGLVSPRCPTGPRLRKPWTPVRQALWFALCLALVLDPTRALALHRNLPFLLAVSQRPGTNVNASPSWGDPHWVSFESTDDLLHNGSRGHQIFLWNSKIAAGLECQEGNVPGPVLRQITRFPEGAAHPDTSESGRVVVFDSTADLLGNGSRAHKIFMWSRTDRCFSDGPWSDPSGGSMVQLTNGDADCTRPTINAQSLNNAGYIVAFQCERSGGSQGRRVQPERPAAAADVPHDRRWYERPGEPGRERSSHFESTTDLPANRPMPPSAAGFSQIYAYNVRLDRRFRVTSGAADSINPSPAQLKPGQTWPLIAFQSRADLLANGSSGWQIFLLDPDTGELRQITRGFGESTNPSLGGPGDLLAFLSTEDLLGTGTFGQHIFFTDLRLAGCSTSRAPPARRTGTRRRAVATSSCSSRPTTCSGRASRDGSRIFSTPGAASRSRSSASGTCGSSKEVSPAGAGGR